MTEIPVNCVFNKGVTGCGATTLAITQPGNTIIAMPYVGLVDSLCKAVSDSLVPRTMAAAAELGYHKIAVAGGVAANSRIRADFQRSAAEAGAQLFIPPLKLCGDNAAMIGCQGYYEYLAGHTAGSDLNAYASMKL